MELLGGQGRIHSIEHREERFGAIAKAYAARPEGTLVISPDNKSRQELNTAIRYELRRNGNLKPDAYTVPILVNRQDLTGEDRGRAGSYRIGDSVRYLKGSKTFGLDAKSYATVISSDTETNRITVRKADGRTITYDPARLKGVTVYQPESRAFAEGERVQFTAPWRDKGISNRETGTVFGQRQKPTKMFRAGLYARVSTHDQQTLSLQVRAMREYAAKRGWAIAVQIKEVGSGAAERELRETLLAAARRREIDVVLVWRLDRWGRSLLDPVVTLKELAGLGIGFAGLFRNHTSLAGIVLVRQLRGPHLRTCP